MARYLNSFLVPLAVGALAAAATVACGGDDETPSGPGGAGGTGAAGGAAGGGAGGTATGGSAGTATGGSGMATGGTGGSGGGTPSDPYTCYANQGANDPDPGGSDAAGADCCAVAGGTNHLGTCTASSEVSSDPYASNYGYSNCDPAAGLLCAPKPDADQPGGGDTPSCTIDLGGTSYEGRCIPKCFVISTPGANNLDSGDCDATGIDGIDTADVVCAPCYSPLDGQATGACTRRDGDVPVDPPPTPFKECGRFPADDAAAPYLGLCVPTELVTASGAATDQIPQDICEATELCAPKNKIEDISMCFAKCDASLGGEGACVPTYIVEAPGSAGEGLSSVLGQVTCAAGETCTPCISPLDQSVTGACAN
jgi:hypothetical protein